MRQQTDFRRIQVLFRFVCFGCCRRRCCCCRFCCSCYCYDYTPARMHVCMRVVFFLLASFLIIWTFYFLSSSPRSSVHFWHRTDKRFRLWASVAPTIFSLSKIHIRCVSSVFCLSNKEKCVFMEIWETNWLFLIENFTLSAVIGQDICIFIYFNFLLIIFDFTVNEKSKKNKSPAPWIIIINIKLFMYLLNIFMLLDKINDLDFRQKFELTESERF